MPDLDQLDRAFDALARDLSRSPGPGAAAAIATARKRRRTRVGAVALTALVLVGGGLAVPRLAFPEGGVAAGGGAARFDAAALEVATEGWADDWEPWDRSSTKVSGSFGKAGCVDGYTGGGEGPGPTGTASSRFIAAARATAVLVVERYASEADAAASQDVSGPEPDTCGATTFFIVDGVRVRHDSAPPEGDGGAYGGTDAWLGDVWTVQDGRDRAVLEMVSTVGVAERDTAERVAEALVAGVRDGWTQSGG